MTELYPLMDINDFWNVLANEFNWDYYKDEISDDPNDPSSVAREYHARIKSVVLDDVMKFGPIYNAWQNHKYKLAPEPVKSDFIK